MAVYKFEALDAAGSVSKGLVEADSQRAARSRLRDLKLLPLQVDAVDEPAAARRSNWLERRRKRLTGAQLSLITRQLSTLLAAGLTVSQALGAVIDQIEQEPSREIVASVRAEVLAGSSLSQALGKHPGVFPEIYQAVVNAGEESGELAHIMDGLANYIESRQALQQKVVLALVYPAVVTLVALLVVSGLLIYVVPQMVAVFEHSRQTLPLLTRLLIALSGFLKAAWPYLLVLLGAAAWLAKIALARDAIRLRWHRQILGLPVLGKLVRSLNTARIASTLAILVGSGVPIIRAMQAAARVTANLPMRQAIDNAISMIRDGSGLSRALAASNLFPPILIHLIASAESTGKLDAMLDKAAVQQEREVENRLSLLTGLMEPALILVMGGIVLAIVLAVLMPIIEMNQLIK